MKALPARPRPIQGGVSIWAAAERQFGGAPLDFAVPTVIHSYYLAAIYTHRRNRQVTDSGQLHSRSEHIRA
jgi:hypothetical protein